MKSTFIILESYTEVRKAAAYLGKLNINVSIEKSTVKSSSCSYGIRVFEDPDKICKHLEIANIKCKSIVRGG